MKYVLLLLSLFSYVYAAAPTRTPQNLNLFNEGVILKSQKINVPGKGCMYNPSMVKYGDKILMAFRRDPVPRRNGVAEICLVLLDEHLSVCGEVTTLNLRKANPQTPCRSEDPRILWCGDKLYLFYNDNTATSKKLSSRREMYLCEIIQRSDTFIAGEPVLLKHPHNYPQRTQEKNWTPFVYDGQLLLAYTINPHEILVPNLETGECELFSNTTCEPASEINFQWKNLRGGTPALRFGDYYLAFFHSSKVMRSNVSEKRARYHYFAGAYLFSSEPPFEIVAMSPHPIVGNQFYSCATAPKRVVYPCGFLIQEDKVLMCYGKDDCSIHIATIDLDRLLESMMPVFPEKPKTSNKKKKKKGLTIAAGVL